MRRYALLFALAFGGLAACGDSDDSKECTSSSDCSGTQICSAGECIANPNPTVTCDNLDAPANGSVNHAKPARFTDVATYSCANGFDLEGEATRTCTSEGQWTGSAPVCLDNSITCPTLTAPENVNITQPAEAKRGDKATFSCANANLGLTGPAEITCNADGTWSAEVPQCLACDQFSVNGIEGGIYDPETEEYTVISGFDLDGLNTTTELEEGEEKAPSNGCGLVDWQDGVDNQLMPLLVELDAFGLGIVSGISQGLQNDVNVFARVYSQQDGSRTMSIFKGDEVLVDNVPATLEADGTISAEAPQFQLALQNVKIMDAPILDEEGEPTGETTPVTLDFVLTLNNVKFNYDEAAGILNAGGVVIYGDESTGEETLRPSILRALAALAEANPDFNVPPIVVDSLFGSSGDLSLDGSACDAISIGMYFVGQATTCQ